jgi:hypothetical protein
MGGIGRFVRGMAAVSRCVCADELDGEADLAYCGGSPQAERASRQKTSAGSNSIGRRVGTRLRDVSGGGGAERVSVTKLRMADILHDGRK